MDSAIRNRHVLLAGENRAFPDFWGRRTIVKILC